MDARIAFVGLGSNLGSRLQYLLDARAALDDTPGIAVVGASRLYETEPEGPPPQGPYLNAVLAVETAQEPAALLRRMLDIERSAGRVRDADQPRWGPRSLDLDLLLYADRCLDEPGLVVPHPRLHLRAFVLEPLAELAGDWPHPRLGEPLRRHRDRVRDPEQVRVLDEPRWRPCGLASNRTPG